MNLKFLWYQDSSKGKERDLSDLSAKDEWNDAHRTYPPCLRERCLITVVQIAAYVNMIWHTMMMISIKHMLQQICSDLSGHLVLWAYR